MSLNRHSHTGTVVADKTRNDKDKHSFLETSIVENHTIVLSIY